MYALHLGTSPEAKAFGARNNYVLFPDSSEQSRIRELRISRISKHEPTPIFDELNENLWYEFYSEWSSREMLDQTKKLGFCLVRGGNFTPREGIIEQMVAYWKARMEELTTTRKHIIQIGD